MVVVVLVATALRLIALPTLPLGLHYDEAANLILTREIVAGEKWPLFITSYTGKEVLFFYVAAPWVWITGGEPWGLRLGAAMLGVLTVAATYPAVLALLGPGKHTRWVALFAAAWMAVAFPHVLLSRYGFRAISQPLLQSLCVVLLFRGLHTGRRTLLIFAGVCLGLTGYTYLAARLFPIPLTLMGLTLLWRAPKEQRARLLYNLLWVLGAALIAFAPLGSYFIMHQDQFMTRISQVASATWWDALQGVLLCLKAIGLPGAGDAYIRFNLPGKPMLGIPAVLLGLLGLFVFVRREIEDIITFAGRVFLVSSLLVMVLPSALATGEITPSNLRLVGLYPFITVLPALGLVTILSWLMNLGTRWRDRAVFIIGGALALILIMGGYTTFRDYHAWAGSSALFYAADGEMVLAAQALDTLDLTDTTVYIASLHYRHPTVASLAQNYKRAKWLTGGQTLVLPQEGAALYLLPRSPSPPASWPAAITHRWQSTTFNDPNDEPALWAQRLSAADIATLRPVGAVADFAHIVKVYGIQGQETCRVGSSCPVLVSWEPVTGYADALQPVVSLNHPRTGEWSRVTEFHYPPEQWSPGDLVLDYATLPLPVGLPPVSGYEIAVGFFSPGNEHRAPLPRLGEADQFAGLDVRLPLSTTMLPVAAPSDMGCAVWDSPVAVHDLYLWGQDTVQKEFYPGEKLPLTLCWQSQSAASQDAPVRLVLVGDDARTLYAGDPVQGAYPFSLWLAQEVIEDRYQLHIPRDMQPGEYRLQSFVGDLLLYDFGPVRILPLDRAFTAPEPMYPLRVDFGVHKGYGDKQLRLLGYDMGEPQPSQSLEITFYWQTLSEMDEDYKVFVHWVNAETGQILAQVDEVPRNGTYPTSLWLAGEVITDTHTLVLPTELPQKSAIRVGFYIQQTGQRLYAGDEAALNLPGS